MSDQPRGRRPEWLIATPPHILPYTEPAELGDDGHLTLPEFGRRLVLWFGDITGVELLADLRQAGCVTITPWETYGDAVAAIIEQLISAPEIDYEQVAILRAQFLRMKSYSKGRIKPPDLMLAELNFPSTGPKRCYVAFFPKKIEVRSVVYHREQLRARGLDVGTLDSIKAE